MKTVGTDGRGIAKAAEVTRAGKVLLYPTETVYGLGGLASIEPVAIRVRQLKGRSDDSPMLVLTDEWERVTAWFAELSEPARRLIAYGPYLPATLLFTASTHAPHHLLGPEGLVGVRRTGNAFCRSLIEIVGEPLLSTSANRTGEQPPHKFEDIDQTIREGVDLAVNAGYALQGTPSTVIRFDGERVVVVREGATDAQTIHDIVG